jgi:hypothetical protein
LHASGIQKVTDKDQVLARLLSGIWMENPYFSFEDFGYLQLTTFYSSRLITEGAFSETIHDVEDFEVCRTYFNFSGDAQFTETATLQRDEFWFRVKYLQRRMEESKGQPILSLELPLAQSVRVLKRKGRGNGEVKPCSKQP